MEKINNLIKQFVVERPEDTIDKDKDYKKDGLWYCGKCNKKKEHYVKIGYDDNTGEDINMIGIVLCDCEKELKSKKDKAFKMQRKQTRLEQLRKQGLRSRHDLSKNFKMDDNKDSNESKIARNYVKHFDYMLENNTGLFLYGDVGTGKTFYALCIANALINQGRSVYFTTLSEQVEKLSGFDKVNNRLALDKIRSTDLLILDDVGTERDTEFANEKIFEVLDAREQARKPIIATSNLAPNDFKDENNSFNNKIYDRLLVLATVPIRLTGASRREKEKEASASQAVDLLLDFD